VKVVRLTVSAKIQ